MTKEYSFYPGCSSQKAASGSNYQVSVDAMCKELDIQLNEIPDWNCCAASIGYAEGGELPRLALSARNMALSEQANPDQDVRIVLAFGGMGKAYTRFELQPEQGATRLTWAFDMHFGYNIPGRIMGLLIGDNIGDYYDKGLADLKQLLEGK